MRFARIRARKPAKQIGPAALKVAIVTKYSKAVCFEFEITLKNVRMDYRLIFRGMSMFNSSAGNMSAATFYSNQTIVRAVSTVRRDWPVKATKINLGMCQTFKISYHPQK